MKFVCRLLLSMCIFATLYAQAEVPSGYYHGIEAVEHRIKSRMIRPGQRDNWGVAIYLGGYVETPKDPNSLEGLMGLYNDGKFQNGEPNALNWTIYYIAFAGLANDFSNQQQPFIAKSTSNYFNHTSKQLVQKLGRELRSNNLFTEESLTDLWLLVMGFDAHFDEFDNWRQFANSEQLSPLPPQQRVALIVKAILLNPYFLIRQ